MGRHRVSDEEGGCLLAVALVLLVAICIGVLTKEPPPPPPPKIEVPETKDVGRGTGRRAADFLGGFRDGWREGGTRSTHK